MRDKDQGVMRILQVLRMALVAALGLDRPRLLPTFTATSSSSFVSMSSSTFTRNYVYRAFAIPSYLLSSGRSAR